MIYVSRQSIGPPCRISRLPTRRQQIKNSFLAEGKENTSRREKTGGATDHTNARTKTNGNRTINSQESGGEDKGEGRARYLRQQRKQQRWPLYKRTRDGFTSERTRHKIHPMYRRNTLARCVHESCERSTWVDDNVPCTSYLCTPEYEHSSSARRAVLLSSTYFTQHLLVVDNTGALKRRGTR